MPTYEYECTSCKHKFEILQSITAKPKLNAPSAVKSLKNWLAAPQVLFLKAPVFMLQIIKNPVNRKITRKLKLAPMLIPDARVARAINNHFNLLFLAFFMINY